MTHEYTLLVHATVITGRDEPHASAIAWAGDTVIAIGDDDGVRGISRGDSLLVDLGGLTVVPLGHGPGAAWPTDATLEVGGMADLAILDRDPRDRAPASLAPGAVIAEVRSGRVTAGALPGAAARLGIVVLAVGDLERATAFYRAAFGWPAEVDTLAYVEFRLPAGMRLGLYLREAFGRTVGAEPHAPPSGSLASTELYLFPGDLEPAVERALAAGARLLRPVSPRDWGDDVAYLADPDGNVIALAQPSGSADHPGGSARSGAP
jgi:catechol 2,3-dioxygenase-like lactoylglutathione lyase family enzyme